MCCASVSTVMISAPSNGKWSQPTESPTLTEISFCLKFCATCATWKWWCFLFDLNFKKFLKCCVNKETRRQSWSPQTMCVFYFKNCSLHPFSRLFLRKTWTQCSAKWTCHISTIQIVSGHHIHSPTTWNTAYHPLLGYCSKYVTLPFPTVYKEGTNFHKVSNV